MKRARVPLQARAGLFCLAVLIALFVFGNLTLVPAAAAAGPYYISEILPNPPGADAPHEYIELRGPANTALPAGTYLVGIEGDSGVGPGDVQTIFDLSGRTFGSCASSTAFIPPSPAQTC